MTAFGKILKKLRMREGLSQKELAEKCVPSLNPTQISLYERQNIRPGYNQLIIFKKALNCSYDDLFYKPVSEMGGEL